MLTKNQWAVIGLLVGLPIIAFVVLTIISPRYTGRFLEPSSLQLPVILCIIGLTVLNFATLYFGMHSENRRKAKRKTDERIRQPWYVIRIPILCAIFFTLPTMGLVVLYPSALVLLQSGY
jgi:heme/copper-type cytochrome/quinol oxidase subunit 1